MKVRVKREMPLARVGEEFKVAFDLNIRGITYTMGCIRDMITDGWLEEVKEPESLQDKISIWFRDESLKTCHGSREIAKLATAHFRERFDNFAVGNIRPSSERDLLCKLQDALFRESAHE